MPPAPSGQPGFNDRALTGLRGLAALVVLVHHYILAGLSFDRWWAPWERPFYLAVDLFFVLSGYVMCLAYAVWFPHGPRLAALPAYAAFMLRRLARLWPLHAAVTTFVIVEGTWRGTLAVWPKLVAANFLLVQSWGVNQSINAPSWSISTELAAYLLFPVLLALAVNGSAARAWLMAAGAVGAVLASAFVLPGVPDARRGLLDVHMGWSALPVLRCLGGFTIGLLLFRVLRHQGVRHAASQAWAAPAALACLGAALLLPAPDLLTYLFLPLVVATVHASAGARWLGSPALHTLGVLSYALYLVHYPILTILAEHHLIRGYEFPLTAALCLAVAYAAHRFVELPGRRAILWLRPLVSRAAPAR